MHLGRKVHVLAGLMLSSTAANAEVGVTAEEIIVTAQGRAEMSQDVPFSLQSFSDKDLLERDLQDLRAIAPFVPGFYVDSQYPTTPSIVIRGISSETADLTAEPRISIYQDGVYVSRPQSALFELYDIERVEVIKGPHSTMFGRSALTGAVSIIQHKAEPGAFEATARLGAGNRKGYLGEVVLNVPTSDNAAVRVAGLTRHRDGYVTNLAGGPDLNGNRIRALRGAAHLDLAGGGQFDVIANAQWDKFTGLPYKSGVFVPTDPVSGAPIGSLDPASPAYLTAALSFPLGDLGGKRSLKGATLLFEQPINDALSLSAIGAWNRFRAEFVGDVDGFAFETATTGEVTRNRQWSGEIRIKYQPSNRFFAFVGGNLADEAGSQDILLQVDERELLALQTGFLDRNNPVPLPEEIYASRQLVAGQLQAIAGASGVALDGNLALALASNLLSDHTERLLRTADNRFTEVFGGFKAGLAPGLSVELGTRYTHERKRSGVAADILQRSVLAGFFGAIALPPPVRDPLLQALAIPGAPFIPAGQAYPVPSFGLLYQQTALAEAKLSGRGLSWRATALYEAAPSLNLYGTYARGRRPEVLSPQAASNPGGEGRFTRLDSEVVDSLEFGLKYIAEGISLDAAMFNYDYRHFQTEILQGTTLVSLDAGEANAIGGELSASYRPFPWGSLFASYGYTRARFGGEIYKGNAMRLSPDHSLSAGARSQFPFGPGNLSIMPTINWRSRVQFDNSNGDPAAFGGAFLQPLPFAAFQKAYALASLHLGYQFTGSPVRLQAHVQNLFDKSYVRDIGTGSVSFGLPSYVAGEPRTFLLTAFMSLGD